MRRLFITLAICISTVLGAQAQTYKEQLKAFMTTGATIISVDDMSGNLSKLLPAGTPNTLLERYAKEQMTDDIADILLPYYEKTTSMEDLKTLKAFYDKPEIKPIEKKLSTLPQNMQQKATAMLEPAIRSLVTGQEAQDIKLENGISGDYASLCKDYLNKSGMSDMFDGIFGMVKQMGAAGSDPRIEKLLKFLNNNLPTIMVNALHEQISMDELKMLSTVTDTPAFQHMVEGNKAMMKDIMPISMQLKEKAESWINNHK